MNKHIIYSIFFLFFLQLSPAQEITETNTDIIYKRALEAYQQQEFDRALDLTEKGLELAPEYHDIRILQIRVHWALENFIRADEQLRYLWEQAPGYVDVKPVTAQRVERFEQPEKALQFLEQALLVYPGDLDLQVKKARLLLENKQRKEARELALDLITREGISGPNRYILQTVLNRSVSDEIGLSYQVISFSEVYARDDIWHISSAEYQHNFNRTAVIGRVNYSDRGYDSGMMYELEAYPVFNDRLYAFTNIGVSNGSIFPDVRTSLSVFYNFANKLESELGGRMLLFGGTSYFTGIMGLTAYQGKFYINARAFIGPKRLGELVQNYQGNLRYYFRTADNYLFLRVGSGISPDEQTIFSRVQENPKLDVYYGSLGLNKTLGVHHIVQLSAGFISENIENTATGTQLTAGISYRYRF